MGEIKRCILASSLRVASYILTISLPQLRMWFNYRHESQSCHCYPWWLQKSVLDFLAGKSASVLQLIDISPWKQHAWCSAFREGQRTHLEGLWWLLDAWALADGWESAYRKCLFGWVANINITQLALQRSDWLYRSLQQIFSVFFSLCEAGKKSNNLTLVLSTPFWYCEEAAEESNSLLLPVIRRVFCLDTDVMFKD